MKEFEMEVDYNDGYRYMFSVIDHFSNYGFAFACYSKKAEEIAAHLYSIFCQFGPPKYLQADNGGEFVLTELLTFWQKSTI
jgi:hypothetical protein